MKIFRTLQRHYTILGICPSDQPIQNHPPNKRVLFGFLIMSCSIILHFMNIFCVANDFMEYMEGISATSSCSIDYVCFAVIVLRKTIVFEGINKIEKLIDTSEPHFLLEF